MLYDWVNIYCWLIKAVSNISLEIIFELANNIFNRFFLIKKKTHVGKVVKKIKKKLPIPTLCKPKFHKKKKKQITQKKYATTATEPDITSQPKPRNTKKTRPT